MRLRRAPNAVGYMKNQADRTRNNCLLASARLMRMRAVPASGVRSLRGLKNISWLTSRQLNRLADALTISRVEKRGIIFDEKCAPDAAYVLLSGVARITCSNRSGARTLVIMVAPGMIPGVPPAFAGIRYSFRCEAVTECQIGTVSLATPSSKSHWSGLGRFQADGGELFRSMGSGAIALL